MALLLNSMSTLPADGTLARVLMRKSDDRILTTHVGSIPRNPVLRDLLVRQDRGEPVDTAALAREAEAAVRTVVARQMEIGIDVGNDGEQPRAGFSTYVARRMRGFGGASARLPARDVAEFPDYAEMLARAAPIGGADRRRAAGDRLRALRGPRRGRAGV
jgi:hypothetical protein